MYRLLGLQEAPWDEVLQRGMDPDTYVCGQCADAVRGVAGKADVYMGIGVDAPRTQAEQADMHARYRLSQRAGNLPGRGRRHRLLAQLRRNESEQPRRRRSRAAKNLA